jgi:hypothetical protein
MGEGILQKGNRDMRGKGGLPRKIRKRRLYHSGTMHYSVENQGTLKGLSLD